jgi:hypothetical protein
MKIIYLIGALYIGISSFGQNFSASTPIEVSTGFGLNHPQIEIANDGMPLVSWTNPSGVYVAKHDGGNAFNTPVQLNPSGFDVQNYNWSGPDMAIDGNNVYVVFRSLGYSTGHVYLVKSTDNGASFGDTVRVDDLATGYGQYPDVAVFQDTIWVTFMDHDNSGFDPQYVVARSTDGGLTFETEVAAGSLLSAEACDCCQPEIIVDENRVIVFLRNNNSNIRDIKAVVSTDRGATFTDWFSVDDHSWSINSCPSTGPDARFLDGSTAVAIYKSGSSGDAAIYINQYDLEADASISEVQITSSTSTNESVNYPQLAIENGIIGVVWEALNSNFGRDVWINSSSSGVDGLNPDNAFNLTDSLTTQSKPDIAISDGYFHVVYADNSAGHIKYLKTFSLTGLEEDNIEVNLSLYPNPAVEELYVSFELPTRYIGSVEIVDMQGRKVYNAPIKGENKFSTEINVSSWKTGVYICNVMLNSQVYTKQFTI